VLNTAVPTSSSPDDAAMIQLERGRALMVIESFDAAIDAFNTGLDAVSDASLRAALLYDLARAESSVGLLDRAVEHSVEARHSFEAAGDRRHLVSALRVLGGVYEDLGRLDEAAGTLREGLALAETIGHAEEVGGCLVNLALVELARGNHDAAVACDLQAIDELSRIGHPALATAYANLAEALLARGDTERVQEYCERAIALASQRHDMLTVADAGLTAARAELLLGHGEQAAAAAEIAAAHFLEVGSKDWAAKAMEIAALGRAPADPG
jgi:tetratricopeptide (TPR) repeat protein